MAAVVREIWGKYPSFLKLARTKTLLDLIVDLPNSGHGRRVAPTIWHKRGKKLSWYEIDRIELDPETSNATIFGTKVLEGVRADRIAPIGIAFTENWAFHYSPKEMETIESKLSLKDV
ncbi:hypothetical protein BASA50_001562 [Batrachochytrium salamandrivorans]|uniref:Uncharacterized protein n=1 Tax=Batrachochytrium salamandrivorans TaxID=1357716 RepID=A0ABQ8FRT6_9FUNG|nr:hypothetical protein BASA62_003611 [Batrachochytrium salamandrivorans]KAH6573003.1 hypothetical protein BASA60_006274 [Batrachochytrium salamandrivorans]KAH6597594.1 hypothetical protein BASA61_003094 [Batrachochytrium salamandrivorans]KAH6601524.1 hypothetical protein BASA50_001562 [Batrachochytrium salamandrivorans]KAH9249927.1 hypothetical protein BASA81_012304 [Batrachochytrium salamandrivorans]